MSATVRRTRKSARDRPRQVMSNEREGGDWDRVHLLSSLGTSFVIRIRILMYPACILKDIYTHTLMYLDVSQ